MSVCLHRHGEHATQPKISDLEQLLLWVDQQVLWLQVSVHDAMLMHEGKSSHQLEHERLQYTGRM